MRILHTYCLNYNLGDYALGIGLKSMLRKHLPVDLIGETNIQGRVFDEYYINEVVNKRYDLLVIGGGGIIHGRHWPNGWFWLIEKDLIKKIKIPFIVYGVGVNYWIEEGGIPAKAVTHLKETIKYALHFSVRNDGSAKRFEQQIGITPDIVPDPGFHVNLNTNYSKYIKEPYIIIQLANDKPEKRFGNSANKADFVNNMRIVVKNLSKEYKIIFAPHVFEDIELSAIISEGIENTSVWDFGYFAFDHSYEAIGFYKYAEFVIAMRGHGQIIPIGFSTPVISLENHPKHIGLMKELGLLEYNVNIKYKTFLDDLIKAIDNIKHKKSLIIKGYKTINSNLLRDTNNALIGIKNSLL